MASNPPILVGVDGSPGSLAAVRYAAREAYRLGTGVRLVHVLPSPVPVGALMPVVPPELNDTGSVIVAEAASVAREQLTVSPVTTSLLEGPRIPMLLRAARQARLIVLGHVRHPSLDRLVTGATVTGVAAHAPCPVVVVPADHVVGERHSCVLVGVKSTEHSEPLLRRGFATAAERDARLLLMHAWELRSEYDDLVYSRLDTHAWESRARAALERGLAPLRDRYPEVRTEIRIVHGQPARVLCEASAQADVLLVARRARAFPGGHLGGTVRALLRHSSCPVVVEPSPEESRPALGLELEEAGSFGT